jgi:hypothetical protein
MGGSVHIERQDGERYLLLDPAMGHRVPVSGIATRPDSTDPDDVPAPVSSAWSFDAERLEFPSGSAMLRTDDGVLYSDSSTDSVTWTGEALVELDLACKLYLTATGTVRVRPSSEKTVVSFDERTPVTLGARSYHTAPAGTVTTTRDPAGLAWAVSHFGGAVMTTTPERSFPTLRGHPPLVELGDERSADAEVTRPESDVTLEVAPRVDAVLAAAPLAYYLATPLELSDDPKLRAAGEQVSLGADGVSPERLLRHVFVCDVAARQYGFYDIEVREGAAVDHLLDFESLYGMPHAERLAAYLTAPMAETVPHAPDWSTVAHTAPEPESIEHLPALVYDLAAVRPTSPETYSGAEARSVALDRFVGAGPTRGTARVFDGHDEFVDLPDTDAFTDVWVGDGIPLNAGKSVRAGYEHSRNGAERDAGDDIRVLVVCNDPSMGEEALAARENYRRRDDLPFDVELREGVSVAKLRELLARDSDLFHFVGHATAAGLECPDGHLDAATVPSVGTTALLLNACQSYPHAVELVERGAGGGLVTIADVGNDAAFEIGTQFARMLSRGYSVGVSRSLLRRATTLSGVYTVVGDAGTSVGQPVDVCTVNTVERHGESYRLEERRITAGQFKTGTMVMSSVFDTTAVLVAGNPVTRSCTEAELFEVLGTENMPVFIDGELHWSGDLTADDLP